eukprot:CAMPEP_0168518142 /NCGR_PEP_ID=MMETSP0405-20121227/6526_1 /TAXON_ID=498012 /ORGANISM="Trichosphaerium sp, Strain Am-I-7 wt" /LENGTH=143 /DNA_ID=CAMNT_0008538397 /DNA_START=175 /DNA_END=606 /DNA_ORIENTATION=-
MQLKRQFQWMADDDVAVQKHLVCSEDVALGWSPLVSQLKDRLEKELETTFNYVLINKYRDGNDKASYHSDNARHDFIASISLGATRKFVLKNKKDTSRKQSFMLTHGSLIVMVGAATQTHWQHSLPVMKRVTESRINLTFRHT